MIDIDTAPIVYFAQADYGGPIKIGSTIRQDTRLASVARELPFNLVCIGTFRGHLFSERFVQFWFQKDCIKGEWFQPCPELMRWAFQARAHGRVHQVPQEPSRSFKVSIRSILYDLEAVGKNLDDLGEVAGVTKTTIKSWMEKDHISSRSFLAAYAVVMTRCGEAVDFLDWRGEFFPAAAGAAA